MIANNAHINSGQLYQWVRKYNEKVIPDFDNVNEQLSLLEE